MEKNKNKLKAAVLNFCLSIALSVWKLLAGLRYTYQSFQVRIYRNTRLTASFFSEVAWKIAGYGFLGLF